MDSRTALTLALQGAVQALADCEGLESRLRDGAANARAPVAVFDTRIANLRRHRDLLETLAGAAAAFTYESDESGEYVTDGEQLVQLTATPDWSTGGYRYTVDGETPEERLPWNLADLTATVQAWSLQKERQ